MAVTISVATQNHFKHADEICTLIEESAKIRGTGIAKRTPEYIQLKMSEGKAVIAVENDAVAGFCYIETWGHHKYVVNSGLIVHPNYRNTGLARKIKAKILELSTQKYPDAKVFGITTSLAVMKINSDLGYKPVTFSELTDDENFWKGCQSCVNYDILTRTERKHCLCTGMIYSPPAKPVEVEKKATRWQKFQDFVSLRKLQFPWRLSTKPTKSESLDDVIEDLKTL